MAVELNYFTQEMECSYKDELYSVRDNGAVMRHCREGKRLRQLDGIWTFGNKNEDKGYLYHSSEVVHRIVATAFLGTPPTTQHVVDHIDTNRCNNRPENLRWVTRLENILLNPITVQNIIYACGSIEAFLADPSILKGNDKDVNFSWMRRVTIDEAAICKGRMMNWAESDKKPSGGTLGEWVFNRGFVESEPVEIPKYTASLTTNAVQENWKTPSEFPGCPQNRVIDCIKKYSDNIKTGDIFSRNQYGDSIVEKYALSSDNHNLWVICKASDEYAIKKWSLAEITYSDNLFIHKSIRSFFTQIGAEKQFALAQGLKWTGEDSIDDYC